MLALFLFADAAGDSGALRVILFLLLILAILLILAGATIALITLNAYRKARLARNDYPARR